MSKFRIGPFAKYLYGLCGLTLVALNIWSLAAVKQLRQRESLRPPGLVLEALPGIRQVQLRDGTRPLEDMGRYGRHVLLFLFSPFDCPAAIEELDEIQRLHEEQPWLDVRAVMFSANNDEAQQTKQHFNLTFPVIADPDGRVSKLLAPPQTPWKVLFNPAASLVFMEEGPGIAPPEKAAFHNRVVYVLRGTQNLGTQDEVPRL